MSNHHRGVRVNAPTHPFRTKKWRQRRLPTYLAGIASVPMSAILGQVRTRDLLNREAGETVFFTDKRIMPDLGIVGTHGFILAPGGCEWAIPDHGGCAFCFYQEAVDDYVGELPLNSREFMAMFMAGFGTMWRSCDAICYFTAGSALNPGEIPPRVIRGIARAITIAPRPQMLRIESRVQWMTDDAIRPLVNTLSIRGKTLDIAIGLETQNDRIRNVLLRKGMMRSKFEDAVRVAKSCGARLTAYVMLKGHWELGEGYAIEECVRTIEYAFAQGISEVQLQPLFICEDGSEMEKRYKAGDVKPPWLWSVVRVLKRTAHLGPVILGPLENEVPPPIAVPHNCPRCSDHLYELITLWRMTMNPGLWTPEHLPACECRAHWEHEVESTMDPPEVIRRSDARRATRGGEVVKFKKQA